MGINLYFIQSSSIRVREVLKKKVNQPFAVHPGWLKSSNRKDLRGEFQKKKKNLPQSDADAYFRSIEIKQRISFQKKTKKLTLVYI